MIKPTVGRVVWYRPLQSDPHAGMNQGPTEDPELRYAAIVAHVIDDATVNLAVFAPNGQAFSVLDVGLVQDPDRPDPGECQWMPYQIGQARERAGAQAAKKAPGDPKSA